jgi:hypothetical protein
LGYQTLGQWNLANRHYANRHFTTDTWSTDIGPEKCYHVLPTSPVILVDKSLLILGASRKCQSAKWFLTKRLRAIMSHPQNNTGKSMLIRLGGINEDEEEPKDNSVVQRILQLLDYNQFGYLIQDEMLKGLVCSLENVSAFEL